MSLLNSVDKDPDRLYKLLPAVYRQRDADQGFPLQALLRVITEQVIVVEADIAQLYDNWFIETCQDWVVPYIADLIGYQGIHEAGEPHGAATAEEQLRDKILIPRRDVANSIRDRRRKGTLSLLEQLARNVAGWPARAIEFYTLLTWFQNINALHLQRGQTVNLRDGDALERLDGPFDKLSHTVDVRSIASHRTQGRYNIPSVGLFVWRLNIYSVTETRARTQEGAGEFFTFSILGNDTQLYTKVQPEAASQQIGTELNFPTPIRLRRFEMDIKQAQKQRQSVSDYYGQDRSLFIWTGHYQQQEGGSQASSIIWEAVPLERIVAADLSDWRRYRPAKDQVVVDTEAGRIAFASNYALRGEVKVLYHYAFSADIGGGEYNRPIFRPAGEYQLFRVSKQEKDIQTVNQALARWENWKRAHPDKPHKAVIEIGDSSVYDVERRISLGEKEVLHIRAANHTRPVIRLEERVGRTNALEVEGASQMTENSGSRLTLDGLLIFGRGVHITGELADVTIRHCTLVPGWDLRQDCEPAYEASLSLSNTDARVTIEHSILGSIAINVSETQMEPLSIKISDSILDARDNEHAALSRSDWQKAYATLEMLRCTVFGEVEVHAIELAENSIFNGLVRVARRQIGCMRFCYVPDDSRTPRRYNCQPDLVKQAVDDEKEMETDEQEIKDEKQRESERVRPLFNSTYYGTPAYCQLADDCAIEIKSGADDESEMGVFHDLFQPQRVANLRARLDEFTPAGIEAGIIYAS